MTCTPSQESHAAGPASSAPMPMTREQVEYWEPSINESVQHKIWEQALLAIDQRAEIERLNNLIEQRKDEQHDACGQREAIAIQRAEAAERRVAELEGDLQVEKMNHADTINRLAKVEAKLAAWERPCDPRDIKAIIWDATYILGKPGWGNMIEKLAAQLRHANERLAKDEK